MEEARSNLILPGNGTQRVLTSRVIQSPLAGVSDIVFRSLLRRWAPDVLLFTEMVSATGLELGHGEFKVDEISQEEGPTGVQLFDYRPAALINAALKAEEAGAFVVDINMGCPVKKVSRKGGGSGLLRTPDLAEKIVNQVVNSIKIPVTVKTRLGWCKATSDPVNFAIRMQNAGAQLLTLHGRTRQDGFSGKANWGAIAEVKESLSIPVIANGDIANAKDAISCLKATKADGVMIGRGVLGAPWVLGQIDQAIRGETPFKTPDSCTRLKVVHEQLQKLLELQGDHGLKICRKHFKWSCIGFKGSENLRKSLMLVDQPKTALSLLEKQIKLLSHSDEI